MSITEETAQEHANDPAVLCCRREAGTEVGPSDLEDPNVIPELEASGLLELPEDVLTVGEVLGAELTETSDSMTPLTPAILEGVTKKEAETEEKSAEGEETEPVETESEVTQKQVAGGEHLEIHIGEGKDIDLKIPVSTFAGGQSEVKKVESKAETESAEVGSEVSGQASGVEEEKEMRNLVKEYYAIEEVKLGSETKLDGTTLYIREDICEDAVEADELVCSIELDIIPESDYEQYSETLMDIQPIAAKKDSDLGTGTTRVADGAVMVVTGVDETGKQIGEFGSSEGILAENIMWDRPGAPDKGDILIKTEVVIKEGSKMERPGPLSAHKATDVITDEIRNALRETEAAPDKEEKLAHKRRPGKEKVVVIKEIMGQGAMHDNLILPDEPVGILGGQPNVDLGNLPVVLSPLEVLDGGVHALTCIGPATKETSRHYWREPLVREVLEDDELDLAGVILVGSPQANSDKFYVSERLGMLIEAMGIDGAFIQTEGFGNNHVDFASHHEQVGKRGVPVVGMSFCANQGALVVGNEHMKYMVDLNKSEGGIENEVLANNTLCKEDAIRATQMLKNAIAGEEVKDPEPNYNPHVKENNLDLIEEKSGEEVDRVPNETSLPQSEE